MPTVKAGMDRTLTQRLTGLDRCGLELALIAGLVVVLASLAPTSEGPHAQTRGGYQTAPTAVGAGRRLATAAISATLFVAVLALSRPRWGADRRRADPPPGICSRHPGLRSGGAVVKPSASRRRPASCMRARCPPNRSRPGRADSR
jgi:hypothetical protein